MSFRNIPSAGSESWKDPVSTFSSLPLVNNTIGDARVTEDTSRIFIWDGDSWNSASPSQSDSFIIIQTPEGTFPTASSPSDALTFESDNNKLSIIGNASTKTVLFRVNDNVATQEDAIIKAIIFG